MPIQSATNCTNTELQTSEFKQMFQHRPVCKTNLGALSAKAPTLQGRLETWLLAQHNIPQFPARLPICRTRLQKTATCQPANLPSFNTLTRVLATCYKTSTTKLALPAHCQGLQFCKALQCCSPGRCAILQPSSTTLHLNVDPSICTSVSCKNAPHLSQNAENGRSLGGDSIYIYI